MDFFCNHCDGIIALLQGGILGAIGQALYISFGLYKLKQQKNAPKAYTDRSTPSAMPGGIFVGFLMGVLLTLVLPSHWISHSVLRIFMGVALGYTAIFCMENITTIAAKRRTALHTETKSKPSYVKPLRSKSVAT